MIGAKRKDMKWMKLQNGLISLALLAASVCACAATDNTFTIATGKDPKYGLTSFSIDNSKGEIKVHSSIGSGPDGTKNPSTLEYRISPDGFFSKAIARGIDNQSQIIYELSKGHDKLKVKALQAGTVTADYEVNVPVANFLFVYKTDASVWQVVIDMIRKNPHPDGIYTFYMAPVTGLGPTQIQPARLIATTKETGKFNGQPVQLTRYALTFNSYSAQLYIDSDNGQLMQADAWTIGIRFIRKDFVLDAWGK
jgi:hypothetical protein